MEKITKIQDPIYTIIINTGLNKAQLTNIQDLIWAI